MFLFAEKHQNLLTAASDDWRVILRDAIANPVVMQAREYQDDAINSILAEWDKRNHTLAVMATGTGKTFTFLETLRRDMERGNFTRALIVAHLQTLIFQPVERIVKNFPDFPDTGVVMGAYDVPHEPVVVATFQSLIASDSRRLHELLSHGTFSHLIVDECHKAASEGYLEIRKTLLDANPDMRILGVTATPDWEALSPIFQSVAVNIDIQKAIEIGALVEPIARGVHLDVSLKDVAMTASGWDDEALGDVMSSDAALATVVATWLEHAENRPTIAFCASVKQAHKLADAFNLCGVSAAAIDASTKQVVRREIFAKHASGEIKVMVNVRTLTEGFDAPYTSCVINCNPTKSVIIYVQQVGRGLRLHPSKSDCLLLDFCPESAPGMIIAGDLIPRSKIINRKTAKTASKAKDVGVILDLFAVDLDEGLVTEPQKVKLKILDLLSKKQNRKRKWTFDGGIASLSIDMGKILAVVAPQYQSIALAEKVRASGVWSELHQRRYEFVSRSHVIEIENSKAGRVIASYDDVEAALDHADRIASKAGVGWLMNRKANDKPPSPKSVEYAKRLGVYREGLSRTAVSQAIGHAIALKVLKKEGVIK